MIYQSRKIFSVLISLFVIIKIISATHYDQSQTGDSNVEVDLKNIQLIALLNSDFISDVFSDYLDYDYNINDFTVKPPKSTTSSLSIDSFPSTESSSTEVSANDELSKTTITLDNSTLKIEESPSPTTPATSQTSEIAQTASSTSKEDDLTNVSLSRDANHQQCPTGFVRDNNNNCRKIQKRFSLLPLAMKLASRSSGRLSREINPTPWLFLKA